MVKMKEFKDTAIREKEDIIPISAEEQMVKFMNENSITKNDVIHISDEGNKITLIWDSLEVY